MRRFPAPTAPRPIERSCLTAILTTLALTAFAASASAQMAGVRYNCQNGPQMTVIYQQSNGQYSLRYVYDGPESAMRTMVSANVHHKHFKDGPNSITLEPDTNTVDYREGNDFYDRCTAFERF